LTLQGINKTGLATLVSQTPRNSVDTEGVEELMATLGGDLKSRSVNATQSK
jgi:hypothetical protein